MHPENFEVIALSASVQNYADREASNSDIMMYAGCGVSFAVAFLWHKKRTIAKNKTNAGSFEFTI